MQLVGNSSARKTILSMAAVYVPVFLLMLFLTWKTPYLSDDFHFNFFWTSIEPTDDFRLSENIGDVIGSTWNYYHLSGGRFFVHFFVFLLTTADKWVFNILNALVFTVFGCLLYRYAFRDESFSAYKQAMVYLSTFLLPCFGDNVLWLSGSVNYLWAGTLLLGAISYTERHIETAGWKSLLISAFLLFLSSLTNETTGGMLLVWLGILLLGKIVSKTLSRAVCIKMITFMAICIIGIVVVVTAPGNYARAKNYSLFFSEDLFEVIGQYASWLFYNYGILIILTILGLVVLFLNERSAIWKAGSLFIASIAGAFALALVGVLLLRPLYLPLVVMFISSWRLLHDLIYYKNNGIMVSKTPLKKSC